MTPRSTWKIELTVKVLRSKKILCQMRGFFEESTSARKPLSFNKLGSGPSICESSVKMYPPLTLKMDSGSVHSCA